MNYTVISKELTGFYGWEKDGDREFRWIGKTAELEVAISNGPGRTLTGYAIIEVGSLKKNKIRVMNGDEILLEKQIAPGWSVLRFEFEISSSYSIVFEVDNVTLDSKRTKGVMLGKFNWIPLSNNQLFFTDPEIVLDDKGEFEIQLSSGIESTNTFLVIDIYDFDNPTHPEGHLGWWKFSMESIENNIKGNLSFNKDEIELSLNDLTPTDCWINEMKVEFERLVVSAVLRDSITNAIIYLEKVPGFKRSIERDKFRSYFHRDWNTPKYATAGFVLPSDCTIRLVSPNLYARDAVGNLCLEIYRMLWQNNIAAELYAENCDLSINDIVKRMKRLRIDTSPNDYLLYFCSTFDPFLEETLLLPFESRIAYFHGITKPELLQVFNPELSVTCTKGLSQLKLFQEFNILSANSYASANLLLSHFDIDSSFEAQDIQIIPPRLLEHGSAMKADSKKKVLPTKILYVGRIKSHKKIDHLLELFSSYLELDANAELWIVGGDADKAYWDYLKWLEECELKIPEKKVQWIGAVSDSELADRYLNASVYVSMSEDEGFCLPILESMMAGLPVFAYGLPAIREVMNAAGIYFMQKNYTHLAKSIYGLLKNQSRLEAVIEKQTEHAIQLSNSMDGQGFLNLLQPSPSRR